MPACACQQEQEEAKRPKSPKREDAQLVEQHWLICARNSAHLWVRRRAARVRWDRGPAGHA